VLLDGGTDHAEMDAGPYLGDAYPQAFVGHGHQAAGKDRGVADAEAAAGVAVPAVLDGGDVEVDDVALLQRPVVGHAVADLVIHRGADRLGIGCVTGWRVVERRRYAALYVHHVVMAEAVEFAGGDTRFDEGFDVVEDFARQAAGGPHLGDVLGGFY
jgi:hypothetical protein